jgi:hypothetical protein
MTPRHALAYACPCCGQSYISDALSDAIDHLDWFFQNRYRISSGFRCPAHNAAVRGDSASLHLTGQAVDLAPDPIPMPDLVRAALSVPAFAVGGFGWYPHRGIIHCDVRSTPTHWCTTSAGPAELHCEWNKRFPLRPLPKVPCIMRIQSTPPPAHS